MTSHLVPSSSQQHCYDVFISFRGEDTRNNFVSHLHKTLSDHHIKVFIDYNLQKGDAFPPALLASIQESLIALVIFSENYADSTWCLRELAKIMECKNSIHKQTIVPVFYKVDPTDVRNQTGTFGDSFNRLQERLQGRLDFDKARSHLMEVGSISGWDSQVTRLESQLIMGIVGDVLTKLNLKPLSCSTNLVGIFSHTEKVESLLCLDTSDVSIVGIWGMGGIGKSTIARAVFNHICKKFHVSHFLPNVRDELKKQSLNDVRDVLLQKIFEKDCQTMGTHNLQPGFIRRQLQQKKVLIVLDDVSDAMELKELLGGHDCYIFGSGSKILVTSRDKQVLKSVTSKIYDVGEMDAADALKLFSLYAFKQNHPTTSFQHLSRRALYYAKGNPLALVVLGSALLSRTKHEWVSAFEGLEKEPDMNIQNVLRLSYNTLSYGQQKMFLDISCFLCGSHKYFLNEYYGSSGPYKIKVLQDKSLISISSSNIIQMHDLLKKMGRSIDQEEHPHRPENHERLWNPVDIRRVLTRKTGRTRIKSISLDMSGIKKMYLDNDVFGRMDSLQYLKFYNVNPHCDEHEKNKVYFWKGSEGLGYLPQGLRFFCWDEFPGKYLPPNFYAEHLVQLWMNGSSVEVLWTGVKNLRNLMVLSLRKCTKLINIPDLSKATKLRWPDLWGCNSCHVPIAFVSEVLEYLNLSGCLNVRRFPKISSKILIYLELSSTDIKEVPPSIESLSRLKELNMKNCKSLSSVSTNILKLKSLESISFHGCIKLESFPEALEPLAKLQLITLADCQSLKRLPQKLYSMTSLKTLHLDGWKNLESLPNDLYSMTSLKTLFLDESGIRKLPTMYADHLHSLQDVSLQAQEDIEEMQAQLRSSISIERLRLKGCHALRMEIFGNAIPCLSSLQELNLSGNKWESLPENMDQLSNLIFLEVSNCKRLRFIGKLPSSLKILVANDCKSLEWIGMDGVSNLRLLMLANCFKLGQVTQRRILTHSRSMIMQSFERSDFYKCIFPFPGTEILEAEYMGMDTGSGATIRFPSFEEWDDFLGFSICVVCAPRNEALLGFRCVIKENDHVWDACWPASNVTLKQSEHLFIGSESRRKVWMGREVSFELKAKVGTLDGIKWEIQPVYKNTRPVFPATTSFMLHPYVVSTAKTEKQEQRASRRRSRSRTTISAPSSINPSPERPSRLRSILKCFCCILVLLVFGYSVVIGPYFGIEEVSWLRRVGKKERHAVCLVLYLSFAS